jgi:hypothetical protein
MKKVTIATIFAALMMISSAAFAQATASGNLTVTATVTGSIQLAFFSDTTAGVALASGSGTNTATLAFGNVSAFGPLTGSIVRTVNANSFTVSSTVDVQVSSTNSTSANYTLKAQLTAPDNTNTWTVGGSTNINTLQTLTATGAYGSKLNFPVAITIPFASTTAATTNISNTINYTALAN